MIFAVNGIRYVRLTRAMFRWSTVVACAVGLAIGSGALNAQVLTGEIDGTVHDATGAVISGATIAVTNTDQDLVVRTLTTNSLGGFVAPLLTVGAYSVKASAPGFDSSTVQGLQVHAGQQTSSVLTLKVGSAVNTITVEAAGVAPQLENAASGSTIENKEVTSLPLSSRNYLQLMYLQPGISGNIPGPDERGNITTNGAVNAQTFSVNGGTTASNAYFLDGADTLKRAGQQPVAFPSIDFIQEINLQRANFSAESGGAGAGFVIVETKSGGSEFHGGAFGFFRSQVFNANTYFGNQAGLPLGPSRYGDFGFDVGGPVWFPGYTHRHNDKTFFFFGQQFLRSLTAVTTTTSNLPTLAERTGTFPTPVCIAYNSAGTTCINSSTSIASIDPIAQEYMKDMIGKLPVPNVPTDPHGITSNAIGTNNENQTLIRIDHQFNDKLSVFLRFLNDPFNLTVPFGFQASTSLPGVATSTMTNGSTNWLGHATWIISPNHILEGGFSHRDNWVTSQVIGSLSSATSPDINVPLPFADTIGQVPHLAIGASSYTATAPYLELNPITQVFINSTNVKGRHTIKLGLNMEWQLGGSTAVGSANAGQFTFSATPVPAGSGTVQYDQAFANFLQSRASTFTQANINTAGTNHTNIFEGYVQDDFHYNSRLTLSAGLRYSYYGSATSGQLGSNYSAIKVLNFDPDTYSAAQAPTIDSNGSVCTVAPCVGGKLPNSSFNATNGMIIGGQNSPFGQDVQATPAKNLAPRVGFAYDPTGKGTTSIRGGFGIFFVTVTANQAKFATSQDVPNVSTPIISNVTFENPGGGTTGSSPGALQALQIHDPGSYNEEYNLDVQKQITQGIVADIGYYGNVGRHLFNNIDANQPLAGAYVSGTNITAGSVTAGNSAKLNQIRPFLGYSYITTQASIFNENYNSLQASLRVRLHGGAIVTGNYTYSNTLTNSRVPQNNANLRAEYGRTPYDRTNLFNVSFDYPLPFFIKQNGFMGRALGGYSVGGVGSYGSGLFLTETNTGVDPGGLGLLAGGPASARPNYISNPNVGAPHTQKAWFNTAAFAPVPAGTAVPGNDGVANILGPGYESWDCNLAKSVKIEEGVDFQFRAEAFNVFNHTNFSAVSTVVGATNNGQVTSAGPNRQLQLGAKIVF